MSIKNVDLILPAQCRGARALLEMTQSELARDAKLGLSTVVDFERRRREVSREAIIEIQIALEKAGVQFIPNNGGGPGVRFKSR